MRILLTSQEFPPETGWGGIGTYVGIVAPALARAGHEVHVLSVVAGQERGERQIDGVRVHRAPLQRPRAIGRLSRLPLTWNRISLARSVAHEVDRLGIDFDVCESPEWGAEGLVLARRRRMPVAVRLHSGASQLFPFIGRTGLDARLSIRCESALVRRADVVTGTRAQTSTIAPALGLDPDFVRSITYPVERETPHPPAAGPPLVLFAGRFEARKGPDVLLRAVPRMLERAPDARVTLLGTDTGTEGGGSYAEGLRDQIARAGIGDAVELVEGWGRERVARELARAAVCTVPSRWESFGYVAAEAAALGRPVVASNIPSLADVVTEGVSGRLVPVDDPAALAGALGDLLTAPEEARRMGAAAVWEMRDRHDPDRVAAETLESYELAISRWERRRRD